MELAIRTLFEAPTVAELASRLRENKNSTARRWCARRGLSGCRSPMPSSGSWFLHRLEGPSATYNIPIALRLEGDLDAVALEGALADVVGATRACARFSRRTEGVAFQQILPAEQAQPALVTEEVVEAALASPAGRSGSHRDGPEPGDPSCEPGYCALSRRATSCCCFCTTLLAMAGRWARCSGSGAGYAARRGGKAPAFAELPVQYADYTLWQREFLGEEGNPESLLSKQLGFWRKALAGAPEELNLPADRPRPAVMSYRGAKGASAAEAEVHRGLRELAQANGASLFMVLQAGLAALLSRLGAGEDIPIGSPIAGRDEPALENLVGLFRQHAGLAHRCLRGSLVPGAARTGSQL